MVFCLPSETPPLVWQKTRLFPDFFSATFPNYKGNIYLLYLSCQLYGSRHFGPRTIGPRTVGPNCPLFQGGQLGPGARLSGAQLSTFSRRTVGPRTVGPLDSWAPDNWAPGKYINLADICSRNVPISDIYSPNIGNIYPMQIYI